MGRPMTSPPLHTPHRPAPTWAAILAAYAALALAFTWPLPLRLASHVPYDLQDPLGFVWIFWWNSQATPLTTAWLHAPIFYPSTGAIVYQDSLLGVWPVTALLQWLGASPLSVHNLLLIASFALSAFTAYLFLHRLIGDRAGAFAGGLAYGFAIFRVSQIPHLNVLLTFWIPLIFLGLHAYLGTRRWRWLALAAVCWAIQGITSGYFLVYSTVLVGMWALYFFRSRLGDYLRCGAAFGAAFAALWPWLSVYRSVHAAYGFRSSGEVDTFGADVMGLLRAPRILTIWGRAFGSDAGEGLFFPGLVLAVVCVTVVVTSRYWSGARFSKVSMAFLGVAAVFCLVTGIAIVAPGTYDLGLLRVSLTRPFKPLSWVWLALLAAFVASPPIRGVIRARSVPGFYALAALALWILALGPTARVMGHDIWYKAPFSWLLLIPGSEAVRVPARMWLLVLLALGVLVAHALARFRRHSPRVAPYVTAAVCAALLVEAWPGGLPMPAPPERYATLEAPADARIPVLELPADEPSRNVAAMYRSTFHRRPVLNGYSRYEPSWFPHLIVGLKAGDAGALAPFSEREAIDILVHTDSPGARRLTSVVEAAGAQVVETADRYTLYRLAKRAAPVPPPVSSSAGIASVAHPARGDVTGDMTDDDPWSAAAAADLVVTLVRPCHLDEVQLGGSFGVATVRVTAMAPERAELWSGPVAEHRVRAALADPRHPRMRLRFPARLVESLTIQPGLDPDRTDTIIASVGVFGPDCSR